MTNIYNLLISSAWAADATESAAQQPDVASSMIRFLPLFLIFAVFYFLLIRPQQKKLEEHAAMVKALKKGDKIITGGGIAGTVVKLEGEEYAIVEIADGVQVKVIRSTITGLADAKKAEKTSADSSKKREG